MKTLIFAKLFSLLIVVMATAFVGGASAELKYYTLTGEIKYTSDSAGLLEQAGLSVGDKVKYVFAVDFEAQGEVIQDDGSLWIAQDAESCEDTYYWKVDSFFIDLIGKRYIDTTDPAPGPAEQKYGLYKYKDYYYDDSRDSNQVTNYTDRPSWNQVILSGANPDDMSMTLSDFFALGSGFHGTETATDPHSSTYSGFDWEAIVTDISEFPPVADTD